MHKYLYSNQSKIATKPVFQKFFELLLDSHMFFTLIFKFIYNNE